MLWLYRLLYPLAFLALAPRYLWRMRRRGGYAESFGQRLGGLPAPAKRPAGVKRIWIQAVSVGEVLAIGPILDGLRDDGVQIYLTTTTSTGFRLARERYGKLTVGIGYFPLDWWPFSRRAWNRIAPDLAILAEGERWPEHARQARARGVRVININARFSERSFRRLRRFARIFPPLARFVFSGIDRFLPCSVPDECRLGELGVRQARMLVAGNIKLDVAILGLSDAEKADLRRSLGLREPMVFLGSSTWPGEEAALLGTLEAARSAGVRCCLLIVPRHAERRNDIEEELRASGLKYHFRSRGPSPNEVDVAVGDTTGELQRLTQLADVVFVGKSLPPHADGQTPVEAAALGKPVLLGPGMANFEAIAADLIARGAALRVSCPASLAVEATALLRDPVRRMEMSAAAAAWHRENRGAAERTLAVIREELRKS